MVPLKTPAFLLYSTITSVLLLHAASGSGAPVNPPHAYQVQAYVQSLDTIPAVDSSKPFVQAMQEATYPGGPSGWMRYLNRVFKYPADAQRDQIEGVVVVQFQVDSLGKVSDITAISGPETGGLREETIRVIKRSGNWIPAQEDGKPVTSIKKQPIIYRLH